MELGRQSEMEIDMNEEDARQAFEEGERLRGAGDYATALAAFDRATTLKPDFADAWLHRGHCLAKLKRHMEALASLEASLKYNPALEVAWLLHGEVLLQMGNHVQAVDSFDKAIELRGWNFKAAWKFKNETLTFLQGWLKQKLPPKPHLDAYDLVTWVEEMLHMFIKQRLRQVFGENEREWWHQGVPEKVRKKCAERREEDPERRPPFNYSDLIDLKEIMDKNWQHFENDVRKAEGNDLSKKHFLDRLVRLNEIRKTVMHPVRGVLTEEDLSLAQQMKSFVARMVSSG